MSDMLVRSEIELSVPVAGRHVNAARSAASHLTTDKSSIQIEIVGEGKNWIYTTFPVKRARQVDVCDRIMKEMSMEMEDYQDQMLCFLKSALEDFSDVVQVVVGWDGSHPWEFYQGKEIDWNCEVYEDEPKPRKLPWCHERWHQAPCEHTVAEVLPVKGKRLYYVYDFGDTWEHVIYRMSDPAADAVAACENTCGTWGVDDVGGAWGLESLVKALRKWGDKDCTDAECMEGEMSGDKRFWYGWGKKTLREKFLAGPNREEVSARLTAMFTEDEHVEDPPYVIDAVQAFKHTSTKVGRNNPCPCGSGKKYKKCCGR